MAVSLQKGQKYELTKGNPSLQRIIAGLGWKLSSYNVNETYDLDVSVFLTGADGRVRNNKDFIYYNNLCHSSGSVEHMGDNKVGGSGGDDEQIRINLAAVPSDVEKITIAVTIYDPENSGKTFGKIQSAYIRIMDDPSGAEIMRFDLGEDFSVEKSVIIGELYRYKGEWKFNAIGSGYGGGLDSLCLKYGLDMSITDLSRGAVILEKGRKVSLAKPGSATGKIHINLNWSRPTQPGRNGIDLDLGCLYELTSGKKGCVQALGNAFGSLTEPPFIFLDGDDRTGNTAGGENLFINGAMTSKIKRILIYTYIYEGIANWREADGIVTVKTPGNRDIIVRMDEYGSSKTMCAIAMIENRDGNSFSIEKLVRFFEGHRDMDQYYNWGLRWVTGHK